MFISHTVYRIFSSYGFMLQTRISPFNLEARWSYFVATTGLGAVSKTSVVHKLLKSETVIHYDYTVT
jgi:hypothetical protein